MGNDGIEHIISQWQPLNRDTNGEPLDLGLPNFQWHIHIISHWYCRTSGPEELSNFFPLIIIKHLPETMGLGGEFPHHGRYWEPPTLQALVEFCTLDLPLASGSILPLWRGYTTIPSGFIKIQPAPPTKDARYQIFFGLEHFLFFHILGKIIPTD